MCGISSGLVSYLNSSSNQSQNSDLAAHESVLLQARDVAAQLAGVRFTDVAPRDHEAEEHARQHLESEDGEEFDDVEANEELAEKRKMETLEDMLARLTPGTKEATQTEQARPTIEDVQRLKGRLKVLCDDLGFPVNWS